MRLAGLSVIVGTVLAALIAHAGPSLSQGVTTVHEPGRCAIRGQCGKKLVFGGELPCLDNGPAAAPNEAMREKLVALCGRKWEDGLVCCKENQVDGFFLGCCCCWLFLYYACMADGWTTGLG